MPNVPTITPGPDDTEHMPEDVTETIPLITNVHLDYQLYPNTSHIHPYMCG